MRLRRRGYLVESKYDIGFSWDTVKGRRQITKKVQDDKFFVSSAGKPIDSNFQEIMSSSDIDFDIKRDSQRLKKHADKKVSDGQELQREKEKEFTYGFSDRFNARQKRKVINALIKVTGFNGKYMMRKEYIHGQVKDGAKVKGNDSGRRLEDVDGAFLDQKQLTKIGMDYAEYLISHKKIR